MAMIFFPSFLIYFFFDFQRRPRELPARIHRRAGAPNTRRRARHRKDRPVRVRRLRIRQSSSDVARRLCLTVQLLTLTPPQTLPQWVFPQQTPQDSVNVSHLYPSSNKTIIKHEPSSQRRGNRRMLFWDQICYPPFHWNFPRTLFPHATTPREP